MRTDFSAITGGPHPELVEGRTAVMPDSSATSRARILRSQLASAAGCSGRHEDVEQGRTTLREAGQRALDRRIASRGLLDPLAVAAIGLGELDVVGRRREHVADELPGPHGRAVAKILVDVPGLRRVAAVVADDDEDGRAVLLREAQR